VVPGAVTVPLDLLNAASAALGLTVVPGEATVALDALGIVSAALGIGVDGGGDVVISLDLLTVVAAVLAARAFIPSTGRMWTVHADGRGATTGEGSRTYVVPARGGVD